MWDFMTSDERPHSEPAGDVCTTSQKNSVCVCDCMCAFAVSSPALLLSRF